ncbi:IST1 homolog [Seminavis robusta]|uniref:IST1 homolog n=1 Tax=Seminavis robusta TaxID=568900 RepID=A0A9N8DMI8_9STRA|nr:IST1 homolog [Seminavis robusta]|eukprot:Sro244_g097130.1 IST1 homolog (270) ;mRNA; f:23380-24189
MIFSSGLNATKLKSQLKMTAGRLEIDAAKKTALMKQNMRVVAELLAESPPKEDKARLRTEALIRDDSTLVAYDILRLECLLLMERVSIMNHCHECPADLVPAVSDLIFAAPRLAIPEMTLVRKQFRAKYGKQFKLRAMRNEGGMLNEKVVKNLSNHPPTKETVNLYMQKICKQYEVDWVPPVELTDLTERDVVATAVPGIPVTTGVRETDADICRKVQQLQTLDIMPPPFAPGYKKDSASVTSKSSGDDDDDAPPADTPVVVAMPCITR